jgi:2,4-dienoyl-CoA reductase-like NADH-dependent reductase (Old Yellow Enzyme family)
MDLFSPLEIRGVKFRNRIGVSPMCQYSCEDGFATDWHLVHLGSRAVGGAGIVMVEASAVEARGRISAQDMGIWKDEHIAPLARVAGFVKEHGAVAGIQLAHAGRKASTAQPWKGGKTVSVADGGWTPVAPSPVPFTQTDAPPAELTRDEIHSITQAFAAAATRSLQAGFNLLEIHGAHGYLMHEFLSPLANKRTDEYGGSYENRTRFALETVAAIRRVWPENLPLFLRLSCTDWVEGGWTIEDSVELARRVKPLGVDLIDCSSGAMVPYAKIPAAPGFQVPFAEQIRREAGIPTAAVGMITEPAQADAIIRTGEADLVLMARQFLKDPYWPVHAAKAPGGADGLSKDGLSKIDTPVQYQRGW